MPETVEQTVNELLTLLNEGQKKEIKNLKEDELFQLHFGLGLTIRNNFGLWNKESKLLKNTGKQHPDDASGVIINALWNTLQLE